MSNNLPQAIEAILFATAEPQSFKSLSDRLSVPTEEIVSALETLAEMLQGHGITLLMHNDTATLVTEASQGALIEAMRKDELQKELSKASAETLAIIAYKDGATKGEIEFIRGVNASYSLRALQMRGLIEQKGSGRAVTYHPTLALLEHFGVSSISELPEYEATKNKLAALSPQTEE